MHLDFPHRCWSEIDLRALTGNVQRIRQRLPAPIRYISVVKADAYGLGARQAVPALRAGGADLFAVANIAEAAEVRQVEPDRPILLLSATLPPEDDFVQDLSLTPTLSTVEEVHRYQRIAEKRNFRLPVHLKIDTGMGRLGVWHQRAGEVAEALRAAPALELRGIYSHFASAGYDADLTQKQRRRFIDTLQDLQDLTDPSVLIHIDNSGGLPTLPGAGPFNAVRVGLLQFGILPETASAQAAFGVSPCFSLHSRISTIKQLPAGAGISYGHTHRLERDSAVAVITAGYADGIPRACSNRGSVLVRGRRCPILGTVTMDEIMIDVTDVPEATCGDTATIVGRQGRAEITINEFSSWSGTIPWESLCAISKRVTRCYR